jgi:NAD-dependent SIR2 family protein deacetylase
VVYPAAGLIAEASARGAFTVEINPETTAAAVDLAIALPAEDALPRLLQSRCAKAFRGSTRREPSER